jgi:hypothetical protein
MDVDVDDLELGVRTDVGLLEFDVHQAFSVGWAKSPTPPVTRGRNAARFCPPWNSKMGFVVGNGAHRCS